MSELALPNSRASDKEWRKYLAQEFAKLLRKHFILEKEIQNAMNELGVPQPNYPAPVANAYRILKKAISSDEDF